MDKYSREFILVEKTEQERNIELIQSIIKTKADLNISNKNFEHAEGDLVDYYSYKIKAAQSKLDYLIKTVKKQGLSLDMIEEFGIRKERKII